MTKQNKTVRPGLLLVALLALVMVAAAACGPRGHGKHKEMTQEQMERRMTDKLDYALDDIDATDAQKAKIQTIAAGVLPEIQGLRAMKDPMMKTLGAELLSGKPDAKNVHAVVDDASGPLTAFAHRVADAAIEAHSVLNAEQREALAERWQDGHRDRDIKDGEWMIDAGLNRGLDKMDASDAQSELAFDWKDRLLVDAATIQEQRKKDRAFMMAQMTADKPDAAAIHTLIDRTAKTYTGFAHRAADAAIELGATLTPDQRAFITKMIEEKRR